MTLRPLRLIGPLLGLACGRLHASDYAVEVVEYDASASGAWSDPQTVLGRPAVDTEGDFSMWEDEVAVVPVFGPWKPREIYRIGENTSLVVRFDHPVVDDPLNPCGVDFIIFGNAILKIGQNATWLNGDPNLTTVRTSEVLAERGTVSVSQDGATWRTFTGPAAPFADDFLPTLGRIYDPEHPEPAPENNEWWGAPTIPTYPADPALAPADFNGLTVAQIATKYGYSAGGTGFDLGTLVPPLEWIQYVKVEYSAAVGLSPEIDAFADVAPVVIPDLDCDSDVDGDDLDLFEACATGPAVGPVTPGCERSDFDQDGDVDHDDFGLLQRCMTGPGVLLDWDCMR